MIIFEALKVNTTITELNLESEKEENMEKEKINEERSTGNNFGDEGAKSMSEALKSNTTLTSLNLESEEEREREREREKREMMNE